jgi:hypothetical protein
MKIQVNSDKTIDVNADLTRFVEGEVNRALARFAAKLTRVEVHLSDVDNQKTGKADKRCLIEARPVGDQPRSASGMATTTESAVRQTLGKMQRALTTFFGRRRRPAKEVSAHVVTPKKAAAKKSAKRKPAAKKGTAKKTAAKKSTKLSPRGAKKKGIYQARRKSWPSR